MSVVDAWLGPMSTTVREEYEVGDLDPAGVLAAATEAELAERRAAFRKLRLAAHWADLHPTTADTGVETPGGAALLADESLGGDGTLAVAAFTPEPFALALGMSPSAGAQLIADALDLRHRLPMLWKRLSGWRCRPGRPAGSPARPTASPRPPRSGSTNRSPTAAPAAPSSSTVWSPTPSPRTTPRTHEDRENDTQDGWDVTLTHPDPTDFLGTSHLQATGDTLILTEFYDQVCGSPTSCTSTATPARSASASQGPRHPHRPTPQPPGPPKVKAYVRVEARDLEPDALAVGEIESRRRHPHQDPHLGRPPPSRDPTRPEHGPPRRRRLPRPTPWMRDLVDLRDSHCIFPRCTVDARSCDLDPTFPTTRTDHSAKPGQTTSPASPGDTTAPRPPDAGDTSHARRRLPLARPLRHTYLVTNLGNKSRRNRPDWPDVGLYGRSGRGAPRFHDPTPWGQRVPAHRESDSIRAMAAALRRLRARPDGSWISSRR